MQFYVVYVREAHALDGRSPLGGGNMPIVEEPVTLEERCDVAQVCMTKLELVDLPVLIDGMDNGVDKAYSAAPDRLYLVGRDGTIAYRGGPGPFGFKPDELEAAIRKELGEDVVPAP